MSKAPLDATYTPPNKLVVVHDPKLFVASRQTDHSFMLSAIEHQAKFRPEDAVFVMTHARAATDILDEYVRLTHQGFSKLASWTETSREHTACFHDEEWCGGQGYVHARRSDDEAPIMLVLPRGPRLRARVHGRARHAR